MATPVSHQVRSFCQLMPASWSTAQIVYVLTLGKPSGPISDQLRPSPTRLGPCARPGCRPARSSFFRAGIRVVDFDFATLALADGHTGFAPGPVLLPADAGVVEHSPDRVRTDLGQAIRC